MGLSNSDSADTNFAGNTAIRLIDTAINDIGHSFVQEVVQDIANDIREELHPKVILGELFSDVTSELEELKPSNIIRAVILGK